MIYTEKCIVSLIKSLNKQLKTIQCYYFDNLQYTSIPLCCLTSVRSPLGKMARSGLRQQALSTAWYLRTKSGYRVFHFLMAQIKQFNCWPVSFPPILTNAFQFIRLFVIFSPL